MESSNLLEALKLMIVGLTTVFSVLLIIIYGGKLLIKAVNKIAPEEEPKKVPQPVQNTVSPAVARAIESAVNKATNGKSVVVKIEKL